jgi:lia operon protein LiaF
MQNSGLGDAVFWPLCFLIAGYFFHKYSHRLLGSVMYVFAGLLFIKSLFSITFNLFGYFFAAFLIYAGYRMVTNQSVFGDKEKTKDASKKVDLTKKKDESVHHGIQSAHRNFFIGEVRLIKNPFDLNDLNISGFIGDVKIDLSKAIIPEGESTIVISGLIGDIDIYVPADLEVAITSSAFVGDMDIIGDRSSGLSSKIHTVSPHYESSSRKVKISISLFIGDVDVRYI